MGGNGRQWEANFELSCGLWLVLGLGGVLSAPPMLCSPPTASHYLATFF